MAKQYVVELKCKDDFITMGLKQTSLKLLSVSIQAYGQIDYECHQGLINSNLILLDK
jgi:hypothetical protein